MMASHDLSIYYYTVLVTQFLSKKCFPNEAVVMRDLPSLPQLENIVSASAKIVLNIILKEVQ